MAEQENNPPIAEAIAAEAGKVDVAGDVMDQVLGEAAELLKSNEVAEAAVAEAGYFESVTESVMDAINNSPSASSMMSAFMLTTMLAGHMETANAQSFHDEVEKSGQVYDEVQGIRQREISESLRQTKSDIQKQELLIRQTQTAHKQAIADVQYAPDPAEGKPTKDEQIQTLRAEQLVELDEMIYDLQDLDEKEAKQEKKLRKIERNNRRVRTIRGIVAMIPQQDDSGGTTMER